MGHGKRCATFRDVASQKQRPRFFWARLDTGAIMGA
jgi:hypothetical protein